MRNKRILCLLAAWSLVLTAPGGVTGVAAAEKGIQANGTAADAGAGYSYQLYEDKDTKQQMAEINGYAGKDTDLVIPATLGGYPVGKIGNQAFKGNETMTSLVISEGIYELGFEAFAGCTKLASLSLPGTITFCQDRIFSDCISLKEAELKEGMTMIGYREFEGCTSLENITIPSTITKWRTTYNTTSGLAQTPRDCNVFNGCTALKKIVFTPGPKTLVNFAGVRDCTNLKELDIPASVESIDYAFSQCKYLEKITFHEGLETLGLSAFDECTALKDVQLPNSITEIKNRAFRKCESLEYLVLPPLATDLGNEVTSGCSALQELYLLANAVGTYQTLELGNDGKLYCMAKSRAYNMYLSGMKEEGRENQLATLADAGAKAEPYRGTYDGTAHQAVQMQGVQSGDQVLYRIKDGIFQEEIPELTEPGVHIVEIIVNRMNQGKIAEHSCLTVRARINKRQYEMTLPNTTVTAGEDYTIIPQGYQGTGEPTFYFYKDETCQQACDGKPQTAGVYYVRAEVPENTYDALVQSNVAKLTIQEPQQSTASPSPNPAASSDPDPVTSPSPDPTSSPTPAPGTSASPSPGTSASPGPGSSTTPGPGSSANPGPGSSANPGPGTSANPSPKPVTPHSPCPPPQGTEQKVSVKKVALKGVTSPARKKITVRWKKVKNARGYRVQIALNKKFTKGKKTCSVKKSGTKKTVGKLKSRKKYYVRVRAYRILKGKRYYGAWSKVKKIKVK